MQACQRCGAAEVDAGGCCTGCGQYRGTLSYAVAEPTPYGEPGYPAVNGYAVGSYPGEPVSPAAAYHPVSPAAAPYVEESGRPARGPVHTPLFLLTVMVVVLVIGSVSVVLIRTSDRGDASEGGGAAQSAPATVAPAASASPSAMVDRCVVGDWAVTSMTGKAEHFDLATDAGGIFQLRAEGTGTWDFGSGITLKGTYEGVQSEDLITGRVTFGYRTVGQTFSFQDVQNDVREVLSQGRRDPVNIRTGFDLQVAEYTCGGDALRMKFGGFDLQMGRK